MSLALIQESAKEVRRLAIAGSSLAVGDFRLKKLIPPLEQAGTKVPVFAQVAKAMSELVNGTEADSATHLLTLSTLLNAILYTQGETGAPGELQDIESFTAANNATTRTSARVLKPLLQALTTTGSGRHEIVKQAFERGAFTDLRLIDPAVKALDDPYLELADFIAEKVLPSFGPGIAPRLKATLDVKGKKADARKLKLVHQFDPAGTLDLCKTALDEGSPEVKVAAIECLGQHEECIPLLKEQANSRNKALRAAALQALAAHDRSDIAKFFIDLFKGKALDILVNPFRLIRNKDVVNSLLAEAQRVFDLMLKGDSEQIPRFWQLLDCMEQRMDAETEKFLLSCFNQYEPVAKLKNAPNSTQKGIDVVLRIAALLHAMDSRPGQEAILANPDALPIGLYFRVVLCSALRLWSPERVFVEFSPFLAQSKGPGKAKSEEIHYVILDTSRNSSPRYNWAADWQPEPQQLSHLKQVQWDPRWVDVAIKADQFMIVCCLAKPGEKRVFDYLLKVADQKSSETGLIIQALARCQYPKVTEVFMEAVTRAAKKTRAFFDWDTRLLLGGARFLPPTDLPKLEAFAATLDPAIMDKFLEAIQPLRPSQQSTQP